MRARKAPQSGTTAYIMDIKDPLGHADAGAHHREISNRREAERPQTQRMWVVWQVLEHLVVVDLRRERHVYRRGEQRGQPQGHRHGIEGFDGELGTRCAPLGHGRQMLRVLRMPGVLGVEVYFTATIPPEDARRNLRLGYLGD